MMVASIPLLEFAVKFADGDLKDYYHKHIDEEIGHVEILKQDLAKMGVTEIPLYLDAVEVVGAQYYLIAHVHPAALLGYMAALERESVPDEMIDEIENHHGIKLNCMRLHTKLDSEHIKDLDAEIEKLPEDIKQMVKGNEQYTIAKVEKAFASFGK